MRPDRGRGIVEVRNATADRALDILMTFTVEEPVLAGSVIAGRLGVVRFYRLPLPAKPRLASLPARGRSQPVTRRSQVRRLAPESG